MNSKKNCEEDLFVDQQILNFLNQQSQFRSQKTGIDQNFSSDSIRDSCTANFEDDSKTGQQSRSAEDAQFLQLCFRNDEKKEFQQFLNKELKGQSLQFIWLNHNSNDSGNSINKQNYFLGNKKKKISNGIPKLAKKVRYIQKMKSPKTVFSYYGTDIEVIYQHFSTAHASCLIVPYNELALNQLRGIGFSDKLINSIFKRLDHKKICEMENNEEIITISCKKDVPQLNYDWIYFFKKPNFRFIEEYSAKKLQLCISAILEKVCSYRSNSGIVFPDFQWLGVSRLYKCETFFYGILKAIFEQHRKRRINLKNVSICCQSKQSYFQFTNKLRQLSDVFINNEIIPLQKNI